MSSDVQIYQCAEPDQAQLPKKIDVEEKRATIHSQYTYSISQEH